jgi:hypothetical protein
MRILVVNPPGAAALKLCERLVDLTLTHSRAGLYHARPHPETVTREGALA